MRVIKAEPISDVKFKPFGDFTSIIEPHGSSLGDFYHDKMLFPVSGHMPITFSALIVRKPDKMLVTAVEYHNTTCEGIMPIDDDIIIHVAPPTAEPSPELTRAFVIPKGTAVRLNTGVWHLSPIPVNRDIAHVLILLPERIYKNDCVVVNYSEKDYVEIQL